ncbi:hypothetical protein LLEC1_06505 [Akanthomyces lecanii]|uniref:non-specific serine/threonine protein kinase n=1 Tax=Cordyceps confragosa TaxID=2714763 RepID=A0A179IHI6_CORDF|nr:hypothetical protein LLEC1_06505 [Akanthomyces lecanii]
MDANNAIARLYALPRNRYVVKTTEGTITLSRFAEMPRQNLLTLAPRDDTDTPEESRYAQCIPISFERLPMTSYGMVFGCDEASDVRLPDTGSIGRFHFSIGFDDQRRLIVKDLNSGNGTQVTFDDEGKGVRRNFQWLVGGINALSGRQIIITVSDELSLCLVPETWGIRESEHRDKIDKFRRGAENPGPLHFRIQSGIQSQFKAQRREKAPSSAQDSAIYLQKTLGVGSSGIATYRWNVSTGEEVVIKKPRGKFRPASWMQEAEIMKQLRHASLTRPENILKLIESEFSPLPTLYLEYCPGGALSDIQDELNVGEILQVLQQSLAGLSFAHGLGVVHRDLKPANILVLSRNPFRIKLADFGLAKDIGNLRTWCGTPDFMAPEILTDDGYTAAVDIWSLGALVYDLLFGDSFMSRDPTAPTHGNDYCHAIVRRLDCYLSMNSGTMAEFAAKYMLQISPGKRPSAARCHVLAMALPPPSDQIQRPQSLHFAARDSTADESSGNDEWLTFNGATTANESLTITALSPQTFAIGHTDEGSALIETSTGPGGLTFNSLRSRVNDSGHLVAVPTAHGAVYEEAHWWPSEDTPEAWHVLDSGSECDAVMMDFLPHF